MSSDINLSAAIRSSLITLQGTQTLIDRTQNDLSTGLKVNNAIDNPVAFFQAQALTDRASDFSNKKDGIDQGISSLSSALEGVTGIENIVGQLQGLVLSAESASSTQLTGLVSQYNTLRTQVNSLATDTTYQGLNLVAGTGHVLTVSFSTLTSSNLTVNSVDVTAGARGLALVDVTTATIQGKTSGFQISFLSTFNGKASVNGKASAGGGAALSNNTFYFSGTATSFKSAQALKFSYGTTTLTISIGSAGSTLSTFTTTQTFHDGEILALKASSGVATTVTAKNLVSFNAKLTTVRLHTVTGQFILGAGTPATTQILIDQLQNNLLNLRSQSQAIGSNVALLNTRLDFTNNYVNLLTQGGGKLTLADLNEEGANLLSLQTRQQLGIQALSFAGQNERAVLSLFR